MGIIASLLIVACALAIGWVGQRVGHPRESFEWQAGAFGALYGALLASGLVGLTLTFGLVVDGLPIAAALLGGVAGCGLMVAAFRTFDTRSVAIAQVQRDPVELTH